MIQKYINLYLMEKRNISKKVGKREKTGTEKKRKWGQEREGQEGEEANSKSLK